MLSLSSSVRIYAALGATDMRKSYDTLAEQVRRVIDEDPLSGALFVFCNRARNRIKVLCFDRGGYWLIARRLERGTFAWPREDARGRVVLRAHDLQLIERPRSIRLQASRLVRAGELKTRTFLSEFAAR